MLLAGKKVVVVGGSSGIGLSTAELAKREGADVISHPAMSSGSTGPPTR